MKLDALAVCERDNALHVVGRDAGKGEGLSVPLTDKSVDDATVFCLSVSDASTLARGGVRARSIDGLAILPEPLADAPKNLLLVVGNGAVASWRYVQAEIAAACYVVDEVTDDAIG